jgi:dTMP kinase
MIARGVPAHLTSEPSKGSIGQLLRRILAGKEPGMGPEAIALLFAADRLHHVASEVEPKLSQGVHIVTDRFVYSSLAYQALDLDPDWVSMINRFAPEPDLVLYLRVDPEKAIQRRTLRGGPAELFDADLSQSRIAANYDLLLGSQASDGSFTLDPAGSSWIRLDPAGVRGGGKRIPRGVVLDGNLDIQSIHENIVNLLIHAFGF